MTWLLPTLQVALIQAALLVQSSSTSASNGKFTWPTASGNSRDAFDLAPLSELSGAHIDHQQPQLNAGRSEDASATPVYLQISPSAINRGDGQLQDGTTAAGTVGGVAGGGNNPPGANLPSPGVPTGAPIVVHRQREQPDGEGQQPVPPASPTPQGTPRPKTLGITVHYRPIKNPDGSPASPTTPDQQGAPKPVHIIFTAGPRGPPARKPGIQHATSHPAGGSDAPQNIVSGPLPAAAQENKNTVDKQASAKEQAGKSKQDADSSAGQKSPGGATGHQEAAACEMLGSAGRNSLPGAQQPRVRPMGSHKYGAVAPEGFADKIEPLDEQKQSGGSSGRRASDGGSSTSSSSSSRREQPGKSSSQAAGGNIELPDEATGQALIAQLVLQGVGSELLECIGFPETFHQMDSQVDDYCRRLRQPNYKYPNHPIQTACRKLAKHVVIQLRRLLDTCKHDKVECLKSLWLTTVVPGVTFVTSVMGIPQVNDDVSALGNYVRDIVGSADAPPMWAHARLESNSCIFSYGLQELTKKHNKSKSKKASSKKNHPEADVQKNAGLTLRLLLLLLQSRLVESTMIGFLMSILDLSRCKKTLKKDPDYKVSEKLTVSSKGLFQATLAHWISEAFVVDTKECTPGVTSAFGTKASVLCPSLWAFAKIQAALQPILRDIATSNWEGAKRKASNFDADFAAAAVSQQDLEATQATIKVYAVLSVSLHFALSSWKAKVAVWIVKQKLLSKLLRKALGEVAASIFSHSGSAKEFASAVKSAEGQSSAEPAALLKHASLQVTAVEVGARFYCQTGLQGLGQLMRGAIKVAVQSLGRTQKKELRKAARKGIRSRLGVGFMESISSRSRPEAGAVFLQQSRRIKKEKDYFPFSFLFSRLSVERPYQGTIGAVLGSITGMTLQQALQRVDYGKAKNLLQDSKFLKRSWWKMLSKLLGGLKAGEKGLFFFGALAWITLFVISIPFSIIAGLGVETIAVLCVLSLVLVIMELVEPHGPLQATTAALQSQVH
ncbi:hypothetical protein Efla_006277 [Eimeria flavescens]